MCLLQTIIYHPIQQATQCGFTYIDFREILMRAILQMDAKLAGKFPKVPLFDSERLWGSRGKDATLEDIWKLPYKFCEWYNTDSLLSEKC